MICPSCGTGNQAGAKFCAECGSRLATSCASCGSPLAPSAKFCPECGTPTGTAPAGGPATAAPAGGPSAVPPGTDTAVPARLAQAAPAGTAAGSMTPGPTRLPAAGSPALAERRIVSVLFADLVGFTTLAEGRDPEETRELLSRYFDLARDVVERHGGAVEKFIGDAVMAVWGAPTAREDDAERAVRAAIELVDVVRSLGPEIQARAGVLTGEAAVTLQARGQGMVAGDLVNTASRLQSAAPPGAVLVGETTMRAAAQAIVFEPAGDQVLKGKSSPVPAWQAVRVVAERGGRNRSEGLEAPFVGRDDELRLLKDLFHATERERRPRLVSVIGPAGIGKSRLAWEFLKYVDGLVDTVWWHDGRSPSYGEGITFWALGEMVRARAQLLETDDEATTRAKIAAAVGRHVPDKEERRWIESALLALLGVEALRGGPEQLFGAWRTFFERLAATAPVVMVFEDFHHADTGLLDFVDHLMEWSRGVPIYVLTLSRPELFDRRPHWGAGKRSFISVYLEPLSEAAMRQLLAGLVPGLPEQAIRTIAARSEGVPLYAVETVRMLVADGRLAVRDGVFVPSGALDDLAVPATLHALIASRLDALTTDQRALIADAAVLGQSFTPAALAAVSGMDPAGLEAVLRDLVRREVLTLEADPRSPEHGQYAFVQALIREVAYGTLAKKDRKVRHLAAARFFETLGSDELAGALAGHYLAAFRNTGEGPDADTLAAQAHVALKAAATRAASLGSYEQAVTFAEEAVTVTAGPDEQASLLRAAARWSSTAGHYVQAEALARRAIATSDAASDTPGQASGAALLGTVLIEAGRLDESIGVLESARDGFDSRVDDAVMAELLAPLSRAYMRGDRSADAIAAADRGLAVAEPLALEDVVGELLVNKGSALDNVSRHREGLALIEAGRSLAERLGLVTLQLRAANNLAVGMIEDDFARVASITEDALPLAERAGERSTIAFLLNTFVFGAFFEGRDMGAMLGKLRAMLDSDLEAADRAHLEIPLLFVRANRDGVSDDELDGLRATIEELHDPSLTQLVDYIAAHMALARRDERTVVALCEAAAARDPLDAGPSFAALSTRAALWLGDADLARELLTRQDRRSSARRTAPRAQRLASAAGIAALAGTPTESLALFREALRLFEEAHAGFDVAMTGLDMAILLDPAIPDVRAAAVTSREVFARLGTTPYLDRLDEALARHPGPAQRATTASLDADGRPVA